MQNYPTMSREHSGKKLLVSISNFLFSVAMRLLLTVTGRVIGKPIVA